VQVKISSEFKNDAGVPFVAVLVEPGEPYGVLVRGLDRLVADKRLIEFYDCRHMHTELGQFVSRYYASTLAEHSGPLCLDGGAPDWRVSAENIDLVKRQLLGDADLKQAWLDGFIRRAGFRFGWAGLEPWARSMAEQAYEERRP
jgi:hypothetical protein